MSDLRASVQKASINYSFNDALSHTVCYNRNKFLKCFGRGEKKSVVQYCNRI